MYCAISSLFNSQTLFLFLFLNLSQSSFTSNQIFFLLFSCSKRWTNLVYIVFLSLHRKIHLYCPSLLLQKIVSRQKTDLWVTYSFCFFRVDIASHFPTIQTLLPCHKFFTNFIKPFFFYSFPPIPVFPCFSPHLVLSNL